MSSTSVTSKKFLTTSQIVMVGLLAAMSLIIYPIEFPLTFLFPDFLKIDFSDVPAIIGSVFFGPIIGIFIELIKNLIHYITMSKTFGIGEFSNFIVGVAYVVPLGIIYRKLRGSKGFVVGAIAATVSMVVIGCILNYFITIPLYAKAYNAPVDVFIEAARKIIPFVNSYSKFILITIGSFNLLKALLISVVGFFLSVPLQRFFATVGENKLRK